tara:strand:+ start:285 stop:452 length:168 start_codon:yes stop_codon:yes gene_type:complete
MIFLSIYLVWLLVIDIRINKSIVGIGFLFLEQAAFNKNLLGNLGFKELDIKSHSF